MDKDFQNQEFHISFEGYDDDGVLNLALADLDLKTLQRITAGSSFFSVDLMILVTFLDSLS